MSTQQGTSQLRFVAAVTTRTTAHPTQEDWSAHMGADVFASGLASFLGPDQVLLERVTNTTSKVTISAWTQELQARNMVLLQVFDPALYPSEGITLDQVVTNNGEEHLAQLQRIQLRPWTEEKPQPRVRGQDPLGLRLYCAFGRGADPRDAVSHVEQRLVSAGINGALHTAHSTDRFAIVILTGNDMDEDTLYEGVMEAVQHPLADRREGQARTCLVTGEWLMVQKARPRGAQRSGGNGRRVGQRERAAARQGEATGRTAPPASGAKAASKAAGNERRRRDPTGPAAAPAALDNDFDERVKAAVQKAVADLKEQFNDTMAEFNQLLEAKSKIIEDLERDCRQAKASERRMREQLEQMTARLAGTKGAPSGPTTTQAPTKKVASKSKGSQMVSPPKPTRTAAEVTAEQVAAVKQFNHEAAVDILGAENVSENENMEDDDEEEEEAEVESSGELSAGAILDTGKRAPLERTKSSRLPKQVANGAEESSSSHGEAAADAAQEAPGAKKGFRQKVVDAYFTKKPSASRR